VLIINDLSVHIIICTQWTTCYSHDIRAISNYNHPINSTLHFFLLQPFNLHIRHNREGNTIVTSVSCHK